MNEKDKPSSFEKVNIDTATVDENFAFFSTTCYCPRESGFARAFEADFREETSWQYSKLYFFLRHLSLSIGKTFLSQ